jgi:flagellar basal-body rod modification protein FlgD
MLEQMKQQDPLNPMDNSQMLTQQAQFTQISELQKMNKAVSTNNEVMQAFNLVGKYVSIIDPDNTDNVVKGTVTEANFSSSGSTVVVNGKTFPLSNIFSVTDEKYLAQEDEAGKDTDGKSDGTDPANENKTKV